MKKIISPPIIVLAILFSLCQFAAAQTTADTSRSVVVETKDGSILTGTLISEDSANVVIKTSALGEITVLQSNIKKLTILHSGSLVNGEYWFENPSDTRYVVGPSAIPLKKGEGYYQNLYLFFHSANYAITNHISIGGGTEIASVIFGREVPSMFFFTPKYGAKIGPKLHAGAGILYINVPSNSFLGSGYKPMHYGIGYGVITYGSRDRNATVGLGVNYINRWERDYYYDPITYQTYYIDRHFSEIVPVPTITFSGMYRLKRRFALITENWIITQLRSRYNNGGPQLYSYETSAFFGYGVRFLNERIAVDLGFVNSPEILDDILIGVPYIDFVVKFGGNAKRKKKS